jgi:Ca-activated chloride channel family protein
MKFGNPEYFLFWLVLPVMVGFFIWAYQRRRAALRRFASLELITKLTPSSDLSRQVVKWTLFCGFFFFLVIALVRPRFGVKMEMVTERNRSYRGT